MGASTNVAPVIIKRKKVSGGDGHHGGAWKVAYADFVTAMMAFFMLMWLLNATTEKQRKGLADYFSPTIPIHRVSSGSDKPFGGDSVYSQDTLMKDGAGGSAEFSSDSNKSRGNTGIELTTAMPSEDDPLKTVEEELTGRTGESMVSDELLKHIVTRVTDEGLIIELFSLEEAPLFEPENDTPTSLLVALLEMIAQVTLPLENGVAISGHVRASPVVLANNPVWPLSTARAVKTREVLEQAGTPASRMKRVTGHADREPVADNPMALRNNRIEITLLRR